MRCVDRRFKRGAYLLFMPSLPLPETSMNTATRYELCFQPLLPDGRGCVFACDCDGHVDMDAMGERSRLNYLYARTVIGREFARPAVRASDLH
jgi:hypothetical protein